MGNLSCPGMESHILIRHLNDLFEAWSSQEQTPTILRTCIETRPSKENRGFQI